MPILYQIFVPEQPGLQREGGAVDLRHYDGTDIARGSRFGHIYVSQRLADWLHTTVPEWISLQSATVA
jgi:hypothetical protein